MTADLHNHTEWNGGADDAPWGAGFGHPVEDGADHPATPEPDGHPGPDLLGFLCDFRTASLQAADSTTGGPASARRDSEPVIDAGEIDDDVAAGADDPYAGREIPLAADWWQASDGRWYPPELHPDVPGQPQPEAVTGPDAEERPAASLPAASLGRAKRRSPWSRFHLARSAVPQAC